MVKETFLCWNHVHGWQMKMWQTFIGCLLHRCNRIFIYIYINDCDPWSKIGVYFLWLLRVHFILLSLCLFLSVCICASALRLKRIFDLTSTLFHTKWAKVSRVEEYPRIPFGIKNQLKYFRCSFRLFSSFFSFHVCVCSSILFFVCVFCLLLLFFFIVFCSTHILALRFSVLAFSVQST